MEGNLMNNPYIGIIVSNLFYRKIEKGKRIEALAFIEEAGMENSIIPCFFRFEDLEIGKEQILALVKSISGEYNKMLIPRPSVIHNRGYQGSKLAMKKIRGLQKEGTVIFNDWNRYGKYEIQSILIRNKHISPHLPETVFFNRENMVRMMEKYSQLIIKPNTGSLGKRNMKAEQINQTEWVIGYPNADQLINEVFPMNSWPDVFKTKMSKFIIQERVALAEYDGCPFDIRVSVQKNRTGTWQLTGMVAKVAKAGGYVTNVARGGTCYSLGTVLSNYPFLNEKKVMNQIEELSILIARELEQHYPNLADIGLDIGITSEGFPMFIECNGRDLRIGFRNANMHETWKESYKTPIGYGKYLLETYNTNQIRNV
jgi:hypothetical protein